jgi:hypothetical protein
VHDGPRRIRSRQGDCPGPDSALAIVEIFVVGIVTPLGIDRIPPLPQFTLFPVEEYRV